MSYHETADFLESLYCDSPSSVTMNRSSQSDVEVQADLLSPYLWFVRRPDCHGRIGWETPDLSEGDRWWARCDFEDLPELPEGMSIPLDDDRGPPRLPR